MPAVKLSDHTEQLIEPEMLPIFERMMHGLLNGFMDKADKHMIAISVHTKLTSSQQWKDGANRSAVLTW